LAKCWLFLAPFINWRRSPSFRLPPLIPLLPQGRQVSPPPRRKNVSGRALGLCRHDIVLPASSHCALSAPERCHAGQAPTTFSQVSTYRRPALRCPFLNRVPQEQYPN
jgi:hypothetical protein